ncbi:MerR family transcriptional regulator [Actinomadura gamaensis]|uniref:MerR family transcriptional regulator n=1 Tax=Actinomadura gamaensis TaxID=1763541 RepID=A0ABV9TUI6_9ACTN
MTAPDGLRAGEVAAAAGVNRQTLRYYERRGLLAEPVRSPGGHRLYPAGTVTLLRVIKTAQGLGFTLEEITDLLAGGGRRPRRPHGGLRQRARAKLAEIEGRMAELEAVRDTLRRAVEAGCDDLLDCADQDGCPLPFPGSAGPRG